MNEYGRIYRTMIYGESHGPQIGVIIDGCPAGISFNVDDLKLELAKRKPGMIGSTKRIEDDEPMINSGIFNGKTTGSPINIAYQNNNVSSKDYKEFLDKPRPSHADFVANIKYQGYQDYRGGGPFSGRVTLGIVTSGYFAKKIIPFEITSKFLQIGNETKDFDQEIKNASEKGDSVGAIIELKVSKMSVGLGEPFFDSAESMISHILFSIPSVKGIEFGIGFKGINLYGSEFNDCLIDKNGKTKTNHNGGINGGITNGNDLVVRVFVKPTPSIFIKQETFNFTLDKMDVLEIQGRHDSCIAKRVMVVLESALAIALADLYLLNKK